MSTRHHIWISDDNSYVVYSGPPPDDWDSPLVSNLPKSCQRIAVFDAYAFGLEAAADKALALRNLLNAGYTTDELGIDDWFQF